MRRPQSPKVTELFRFRITILLGVPPRLRTAGFSQLHRIRVNQCRPRCSGSLGTRFLFLLRSCGRTGSTHQRTSHARRSQSRRAQHARHCVTLHSIFASIERALKPFETWLHTVLPAGSWIRPRILHLGWPNRRHFSLAVSIESRRRIGHLCCRKCGHKPHQRCSAPRLSVAFWRRQSMAMVRAQNLGATSTGNRWMDGRRWTSRRRSVLSKRG